MKKLALTAVLCALSIALHQAMTAAATPSTAILSISVCTPTGSGGPGGCPSGTFDTHQIVLAPDGSGRAFNTFAAAGSSDEHSSAFSPGTLGANNDYLFVVASSTAGNPGIGAVILSGGSGPDKSGQWTFDIPKVDGYGSYPKSVFGQVFKAPFSETACPKVADGNPAHQDQTFDLSYAAPGSVVKDPTSGPGALLMIYEGVNSCMGSTGGPKLGAGPNNVNDAYISTGIATSLDYGKTWPTYRGSGSYVFVPVPDAGQTQGPNALSGALSRNVCAGNDCTATPPASYGRYPVLSPHTSLATVVAAGKPLDGTVGDSAISAFVDDANSTSGTYLYTVYGYQPGSLKDPPLPNRSGDLRLARSLLNGGSAPLSFTKWNGSAFDSPGMGGVDSPILPDGAFENCGALSQDRSQGSISYVDQSQQYLLLFVCNSPRDPATGAGNRGGAWFYSTSYDLSDPTQWTPPTEITGSWSEHENSGGCASYKGWYPTPMSLNSKPGHLAANGYIFYLWGCADDAASPTATKRQFSSRAFTITVGTPVPTISQVANAEGESPTIAPNTWVEVKGSNLARAGDSRIWQGSDFSNSKMPVQLDGTSVTVNGKPAYVYYISPTQVNILTPPDAIPGPVPVVVTNNGVASASFTVQSQALSPSFFVFNGGPNVAAIHANGSLIGPARLYPGSTTPAKPGEAFALYANGFGSTNAAIVSGAIAQSGTLSPPPVIRIGGIAATIQFAGLVAPGEFQFNVVVPPNTPDGDQSITATYGGLSTPAGTLITIQR